MRLAKLDNQAKAKAANMTSTLTKSLLKTAMQASRSMRRGCEAAFFEFETTREYRILLQADDGTEVDLEYDKICRVARLWINGFDVRAYN